MQLNLNSPISNIEGVGPKMAEKFARLGVETIEELLFFYPRRYEDYTNITKIGDIGNSKYQITNYKQISNSNLSNNLTVKGTVLEIANKKTRRRGFTVTEAQVTDETGSLKVVWFNQPYLAKMLRPGSWLILNGKVQFDSFSQGLVMESPTRADRPKIVPVYPEVAGIGSFYISKVYNKVKHLVGGVEEWLPGNLLNHESRIMNHGEAENNRTKKQSNNLSLLPIEQAILNIHEPADSAALEAARRRLAFDELFLISLRATLAKEEIKKLSAIPIKIDQSETDSFVHSLPFELTGDQIRAITQILEDLGKSVPMNRLLNGDVGSGKTVVAAVAAFAVRQAGMKTLIMCPTEILANQHFETFKQICGKNIGILTGSKKEMKDSDSIIIGTHALIQKSVELNNIGLVVVDEQHRFGVRQRSALAEITNYKLQMTNKNSNTKFQSYPHILPLSKGELEGVSNVAIEQSSNEKMRPHFLSMTATPIPRTLHLALFGDLDISVITEKPANRKEIKTRLVEEKNREKAYEFIREHLKHGRQVFVICPLIEDKQNTEFRIQNTAELFEEERKSVVSEFEKLKKIFPEFEIAMLHGRLKAKEKDEIMARFQSNQAQLLVSTSVVEVGVDVPNATIMLIEDAERFGLAQIHQFRGRVGRSEHQSFCFLFSNSMGEKSLARLKALEETSDGFKLAEIDLEQRGPGAVFGTEQSGLLDLQMASLSDRELIEQASTAAKAIVPNIQKYPKIMAKLAVFDHSKHME